MLMDVYKLIFKKLEIKNVDNSNSANITNTSYPHRSKKGILLKDRKLSS